MSLNDFKINLKTLPQSPLDVSFVCSTGYSEYKTIQTMAGALLLPFEFVHTPIQNMITSFNSSTYNSIKSGLDDLNGSMKNILRTPIKDLKNISADFGTLGTDLSKNCEFFLSTLPDPTFNLFQDLQYGLLDIINGFVALPNSITNSIFKLLTDFKMMALKDVLSFAYDTFLSPLIALESFMQENGIYYLLDQMHKMEVCMMRSGACHRPPKDYTEPTTHQPWSIYYRRQFLIVNGKSNFNLIANSKTQANQLNNIHANLMSFINF